LDKRLDAIDADVIGGASGNQTDDDRAGRNHPCPRWRNHRAAVGQLDGSKQVAALVGARAPSRILEPPCRPAPSTLPLEPKRESLRAITR
jgi:hypothetical protein